MCNAVGTVGILCLRVRADVDKDSPSLCAPSLHLGTKQKQQPVGAYNAAGPETLLCTCSFCLVPTPQGQSKVVPFSIHYSKHVLIQLFSFASLGIQIQFSGGYAGS